MASEIRFSVHPTGCDRVHHVSPEDVQVVLSRLPRELYARLRGVHFNDRSRGCRRLGYVNSGLTDIALCALAPRMSMNRFLLKDQSPQQFGARRGEQWSRPAIRRFMLYDVFLHELGHLQIVDARRPSEKLRFAHERRAEEFAAYWCDRLWSTSFDHPDPAHNPPTRDEIAQLYSTV